MTHYEYKPKMVCAKKIDFDYEDGKIYNVKFTGGCNGNLKAIGKLVEGMDAQEIADKLEGNTCSFKETSCADQLSKALKECIAGQGSAMH